MAESKTSINNICDNILPPLCGTCVPSGPIRSRAPEVLYKKRMIFRKLSSPILHEPSTRKTRSALAALQTGQRERGRGRRWENKYKLRRGMTEAIWSQNCFTGFTFSVSTSPRGSFCLLCCCFDKDEKIKGRKKEMEDRWKQNVGGEMEEDADEWQDNKKTGTCYVALLALNSQIYFLRILVSLWLL